MNVTFFGSSDQEQEELPWGKDWARSSSNPATPMEVITIYSGDKGLLLETTEYKVFVFKRQKEYSYLLEALIVWTSDATGTKPLITAYLNQKSLKIGINHDGKDVLWMQDGNKFISRRKELTLKDPAVVTRNPFLSPITPPQDAHAPTGSGTASKNKKAPSATQVAQEAS